MPHSPYTYSETIYPPISDLTQYKQDLVYHRVSIENFARDDEREDALLDIGDNLLKHCEFLEGKLNIKKTQYNQLVEKSDNFKQRVDTLTTENQGLKTEIADLKSKLEKLEKEAATKVHEQDSANGVQVDSNDHENSMKQHNPHKRKAEAEADTEIDREAMKKIKEN